MKVRATFKNADAKFGFYDSKVRYNGTEFELLENCDFDPSWMVELEKKKKTSDKPVAVVKKKDFRVEADRGDKSLKWE